MTGSSSSSVKTFIPTQGVAKVLARFGVTVQYVLWNILLQTVLLLLLAVAMNRLVSSMAIKGLQAY